mmetsp:Transcript_12070/g.38399  ORF Transcript_12070/g.38399 Transcript_12070/m.38399 type:complete len:239 (-) Transcript_12070:486-1202(-)
MPRLLAHALTSLAASRKAGSSCAYLRSSAVLQIANLLLTTTSQSTPATVSQQRTTGVRAWRMGSMALYVFPPPLRIAPATSNTTRFAASASALAAVTPARAVASASDAAVAAESAAVASVSTRRSSARRASLAVIASRVAASAASVDGLLFLVVEAGDFDACFGVGGGGAVANSATSTSLASSLAAAGGGGRSSAAKLRRHCTVEADVKRSVSSCGEGGARAGGGAGGGGGPPSASLS